MSRPIETVSKAEFGRRIGLTRNRVYQLVADGLPVTDDNKIDVAKGKRWVARNLDEHRREARKPKVATTSETRSEKLTWESRLRELEFKKRSGELVDRASTERIIFERANLERNKWLGWIPRVVSQLAAEAEADPTKLFAVLDRLVRDHLTQLAATPLTVLRGD
jgi:hypothetical protein